MSNKKTHILVLWAKKAFRWGVQYTLDHTDTFVAFRPNKCCAMIPDSKPTIFTEYGEYYND